MNMLKLNRLEKQVISPVPKRFDLSTQLSECALQFENILDEKNIELDAELCDRLPIVADGELLALVWTNLLSNAVKFTPSGGKVAIKQTVSGETVTVSISDTGCGMDSETRKHIFDKFYQGDTSHSTEGNGLGLPLVKRVLELQDGTVSVVSKLGLGSTFEVCLPINIDSDAEIGTETETNPDSDIEPDTEIDIEKE